MLRKLGVASLLTCLAVVPVAGQRVECGPLTGKVVHMVRPKYPEVAKAAGIQGDVVLEAVIGKQGEIRKLRVVKSASPLLAAAAVEAVQQWRYVPFRLNGYAVEVETTITVHFVLPKKKGAATATEAR